jgi:leucyl/phenylalanyl-tRNA--protein transferase
MHSPAAPFIPAELLLAAYRGGIFPMADSRDDPDVYWVEPRERGVIPLEGFRLSRSPPVPSRGPTIRKPGSAAASKPASARSTPRGTRIRSNAGKTGG